MKLRGLKWIRVARDGLVSALEEISSWFPDDGSPLEFDDDKIDRLRELASELSDVTGSKIPVTLNVVRKTITDLVEYHEKENPRDTALRLLNQCQPEILYFSRSDRTLSTTTNLIQQGTWPNGLLNFARLADFDLQELVNASVGLQSEVREEILRRANKSLASTLTTRWSQSDLEVYLNVQAENNVPFLEIFISSNEGTLFRLEDRSDGLRTYLALIAFLNTKEIMTPPILLVDEAESHLHWDAQADLIRVLYEQQLASQVIYSTHSPGCLPHDLGSAVRSIVPTRSDRSEVVNWVWERDAGIRPLLNHMGASTAALTPHRHAVATEGIADFILLPALLRAALEADFLPYQIVPGIAQLSRNGLRSIDSESDTTVYLTDGDAGGRDLRIFLKKAGIPEARIFSLPKNSVLEDLICEDTLIAAIGEEFHRSGTEFTLPNNLPRAGRSAFLEIWSSNAGVSLPNKRAIACRILDLIANQPDRAAMPLLCEGYRLGLVTLHKSFLSVFEKDR